MQCGNAKQKVDATKLWPTGLHNRWKARKSHSGRRGVVKRAFLGAFWVQRCRQVCFWASHAAWDATNNLLPMRHGEHTFAFCDTSSARTLVHKLALLLVVVASGPIMSFKRLRCCKMVFGVPPRELGKSEMCAAPLVRTRFCKRNVVVRRAQNPPAERGCNEKGTFAKHVHGAAATT